MADTPENKGTSKYVILTLGAIVAGTMGMCSAPRHINYCAPKAPQTEQRKQDKPCTPESMYQRNTPGTYKISD